MVTTLKSKKCKEIVYPWVGEYKTNPKLVVLFTAEKTGTCLTSGSQGNYIGRHSTGWTEESFIPTCIILDSLGE